MMEKLTKVESCHTFTVMADPFFQIFELAIKKLVDFCKSFDGTEIHRAGIVHAFKFTYEQCWKAIQKKAGEEGVTFASPKKAFEWAFQVGWIESTEESIWLEMLSDRNLTTHTYRSAMAEVVSNNVLETYQFQFQKILKKMKEYKN